MGMRGNVKMTSRARRILAGGALALTLIFGAGLVAPTTAQAQNRDRWDRNDRNNRWDRNDRRDGDRGDWNRRQQIERARAIERARRLQWEREQARRRSYNYPRSSPWFGGALPVAAWELSVGLYMTVSGLKTWREPA